MISNNLFDTNGQWSLVDAFHIIKGLNKNSIIHEKETRLSKKVVITDKRKTLWSGYTVGKLIVR